MPLASLRDGKSSAFQQEEAVACKEYHNVASVTMSLPRKRSDACPVVGGHGFDDDDAEKRQEKHSNNLSKKAMKTDLSCGVSRAALGDVSNLESINRNCSSNDLLVNDQSIQENHEAGTEDSRQAPPKVANVVPSELPIANVVHKSLRIDPQSGKPTLRLTLHAPGDAGTLYDVKINIKLSTIPGAGDGAFFTYKGAWRLKESAKQMHPKLRPLRLDREPTKAALQAEVDGRGVIVYLTGESINGNDNGDGLCLSPDADDHQPILIYKEDDYEPADSSVNLPTNQFRIPIGRYGPCREEDLRKEQHLNYLDFIHCCRPSKYAYAVSEKLLDGAQVIDITDPTTGLPHAVARENVPMFVNEVGHDKTLTQNVYGGLSEGGRALDYYFFSHDSLEKDEERECLNNYGPKFEDARVNGGYGKSKCSSSRFERNLEDRHNIDEDIQGRRLELLRQDLAFLWEQVGSPLQRELEGKLSTHLTIAIRRLCWISEAIHDAIKTGNGRQAGTRRKFQGLFRKYQGLVEKSDGINEADEEEEREELCYKRLKESPLPLHPKMKAAAIISLLQDGLVHSEDDVLEAAGVSRRTRAFVELVNAMKKHGMLVIDNEDTTVAYQLHDDMFPRGRPSQPTMSATTAEDVDDDPDPREEGYQSSSPSYDNATTTTTLDESQSVDFAQNQPKDSSLGTNRDKNAPSDEEMKEHRRNLVLHIHLIEHSLWCDSKTCSIKNCAKMKNYLRRHRTCSVEADGGCKKCKRTGTLLDLHDELTNVVPMDPFVPLEKQLLCIAPSV